MARTIQEIVDTINREEQALVPANADAFITTLRRLTDSQIQLLLGVPQSVLSAVAAARTASSGQDEGKRFDDMVVGTGDLTPLSNRQIAFLTARWETVASVDPDTIALLEADNDNGKALRAAREHILELTEDQYDQLLSTSIYRATPRLTALSTLTEAQKGDLSTIANDILDLIWAAMQVFEASYTLAQFNARFSYETFLNTFRFDMIDRTSYLSFSAEKRAFIRAEDVIVSAYASFAGVASDMLQAAVQLTAGEITSLTALSASEYSSILSGVFRERGRNLNLFRSLVNTQSPNQRSVWSLLKQVLGQAIVRLEEIFDMHKDYVNNVIAGQEAGTDTWMRQRVLQYQDDPTGTDPDNALIVQPNGNYQYAVVDETRRIITGASVLTVEVGEAPSDETVMRIKTGLAGGAINPGGFRPMRNAKRATATDPALTDEEKSANALVDRFSQYVATVQFAGPKAEVFEEDLPFYYISFRLKVKYNKNYIAQEGNVRGTDTKPVEDAFDAFVDSIGFDEVIDLNALLLRINALPHFSCAEVMRPDTSGGSTPSRPLHRLFRASHEGVSYIIGEESLRFDATAIPLTVVDGTAEKIGLPPLELEPLPEEPVVPDLPAPPPRTEAPPVPKAIPLPPSTIYSADKTIAAAALDKYNKDVAAIEEENNLAQAAYEARYKAILDKQKADYDALYSRTDPKGSVIVAYETERAAVQARNKVLTDAHDVEETRIGTQFDEVDLDDAGLCTVKPTSGIWHKTIIKIAKDITYEED